MNSSFKLSIMDSAVWCFHERKVLATEYFPIFYHENYHKCTAKGYRNNFLITVFVTTTFPTNYEKHHINCRSPNLHKVSLIYQENYHKCAPKNA